MSPAAISINPFSNLIVRSLRLSAMLLGVACLLVVLYPTSAQEPAAADDEVLKVNTDLLVFPIRVRDKRNPATELTDSDLSIIDKDQATTGLYLFRGADRVALLFALDESGSLRDTISQQRDAALALFNRFGDRSKVAVLRFAERSSLISSFGRDTLATKEAFTFPAKRNERTAIFDAAVTAVKAFDELPPSRSERRIVILVSDGLDNASSAKASQVIATALEKHVSFYVIHLPLFEPRDGRLVIRPIAKGFRDLADKTGGKYFLVGNAAASLALDNDPATNDFTAIFQAIEDDLRSQYLLGFYVSQGSRDGREHRLQVSVRAGVEYQTVNAGYSRTHEFFVKMPADSPEKNK